ncbi:MAG: SpoVA/SpoVAEb family sporulation membrane protein [Lachnospiraceae bacterium]|nr:SpoVA/SpoVAEb family sporulation membrane protein [Lachnospiraceae bacterium]
MNSNNVDIKTVLNETQIDRRNALYNEYVDNVTPKHNPIINMIHAFLVGGVICTIGQLIVTLFMNLGVGKEEAQLYNVMILVLASAILTGLGVYAKIAKYGGAGALVPITGFANSITAPAIEYKKEGQVFGIGCSIFKIAGPVILYGMVSSVVLGSIYWIVKML